MDKYNCSWRSATTTPFIMRKRATLPNAKKITNAPGIWNKLELIHFQRDHTAPKLTEKDRQISALRYENNSLKEKLEEMEQEMATLRSKLQSNSDSSDDSTD
mmetsp:Transcript_5862/g.9081  ORF Transcript_5862/g.9081 Transcript_5862/m.9081 type:complete len:102 (-) Transcript_5862:33-338(-)